MKFSKVCSYIFRIFKMRRIMHQSHLLKFRFLMYVFPCIYNNSQHDVYIRHVTYTCNVNIRTRNVKYASAMQTRGNFFLYSADNNFILVIVTRDNSWYKISINIYIDIIMIVSKLAPKRLNCEKKPSWNPT